MYTKIKLNFLYALKPNKTHLSVLTIFILRFLISGISTNTAFNIVDFGFFLFHSSGTENYTELSRLISCYWIYTTYVHA